MPTYHIVIMRNTPLRGREVAAFVTAQEPSLLVMRHAVLILRDAKEFSANFIKDRFDLEGQSTTARSSNAEVERWLFGAAP